MFDLLFAPLKFLSTPSARRATDRFGSSVETVRISIHALREEGDKLLNGEIPQEDM